MTASEREYEIAVFDRLSRREKEVASLIHKGLTNREIAASLGTSEAVIKNYTRFLFEKTALSDRLELALWYHRLFHAEDMPANLVGCDWNAVLKELTNGLFAVA